MNIAGLVKPNTDDFSVFVGDLAPDVTDYVLQETFRQYYPSVRSAKVIVDPATGRSKGYGFVRFANETERDRALEMQGFQLSNRPIRVSLATARRSSSAGMPGIHPAELDPTNTTLFIGGLSAGVTEDQLRAIFQHYGDVVYTKIPQGKGCGFVQFVNRPDAEQAMAEMNGQIVGSSAIRISWGRSTSRIGGLLTATVPRQAGLLGAYGTAGLSGGFDAYAAAGLGPAAAGLFGTTAADVSAGAYDTSSMYGAYNSGAYDMTTQGLSAGLSALQVQQGLGTSIGNQLLGAGALQSIPQQQLLFDPTAAVDVTKLNALLMQRQQPALTGAFLRPQF